MGLRIRLIQWWYISMSEINLICNWKWIPFFLVASEEKKPVYFEKQVEIIAELTISLAASEKSSHWSEKKKNDVKKEADWAAWVNLLMTFLWLQLLELISFQPLTPVYGFLIHTFLLIFENFSTHNKIEYTNI